MTGQEQRAVDKRGHTQTGRTTGQRHLTVAMVGGRGGGSGGVEAAIMALSVALAKRGHRPIIYARREYVDPGVEVASGVQMVFLPYVPTKHLEAPSHSLLATIHALHREHVDLVHYHAVGPGIFASIPRVLGRSSITTVHGADWERAKWSGPAKLVLRGGGWMATRVPNATVCVSRSLSDQLSSRNRAVRYIPNGVSFSTTDESPVDVVNGHPFLLYLGRLVPEKSAHVLIEAFVRCADRDARLAIVGSANHEDRYEAQLRTLAFRDPRVCLLGERHGAEKMWLLRNASAFVQPSKTEGLPIAMLEAVSQGAPIIASDIPPHREIAAECQLTAVTWFKPEDRNGLASAIEAALSCQNVDSDAQVNVLADTYNWDAIAERTEQVYLEVLATKAHK